MSRRNQKKIATDGASGALSGNPFAALDGSGLPQGKVLPLKSEESKSPGKSKGRVEVRREKSGRGGKTVTTLREFPSHIPLSTLEAMAFELKKICACGGSLKGRVVELQGDVRDRVCEELNSRGYHAVRAGG